MDKAFTELGHNTGLTNGWAFTTSSYNNHFASERHETNNDRQALVSPVGLNSMLTKTHFVTQTVHQAGENSPFKY
jgi:hypothetical protein